MSDIFGMNMFRMRKTKITYVLAAVSCVLSIFIFAVNILVDKLIILGVPEDLVNGGTGMSQNAFEIVQSVLALGVTPMIVLMFSLLFFNADIQSGFVKNTVGFTGNKHELCLANSAVTVIYCVAVTAISLIINFAATLIFYDNLDFSGGIKFAAYVIVSLIEIIAYTLLLTAFSDRFGKTIVVMIFGSVYIMYKDLVYQLISLGVWYIFDKDITVGKYTLLGGISTLSQKSEVTDFLLSGSIALVILILAYFFDVAALRKREIK